MNETLVALTSPVLDRPQTKLKHTFLTSRGTLLSPKKKEKKKNKTLVTFEKHERDPWRPYLPCTWSTPPTTTNPPNLPYLLTYLPSPPTSVVPRGSSAKAGIFHFRHLRDEVYIPPYYQSKYGQMSVWPSGKARLLPSDGPGFDSHWRAFSLFKEKKRKRGRKKERGGGEKTIFWKWRRRRPRAPAQTPRAFFITLPPFYMVETWAHSKGSHFSVKLSTQLKH